MSTWDYWINTHSCEIGVARIRYHVTGLFSELEMRLLSIMGTSAEQLAGPVDNGL